MPFDAMLHRSGFRARSSALGALGALLISLAACQSASEKRQHGPVGAEPPAAAAGAAASGAAGTAAPSGGDGAQAPAVPEPPGSGHSAEPAPAPPVMAQPTPAVPATAAGPASAAAPTCEPMTFVHDLPIAEASGAVVTTIDGKLTVMVIADSRHDGDYLLVDPQTGAVRERGKLPLGQGAGDDLEGLAVRGDRFWALTSAGWLRAWVRRGPPSPGFELVEGPVAIGPLDAPAATSMMCGATKANCGRNFEGLCLAPRLERTGKAAGTAAGKAAGKPSGTGNDTSCVGMAASKADGRLYCIVDTDGHLRVDPARSIAITRPDALADCNIDGETLWTGSNFFDFNRVRRVDGWRDPAHAQVVELGAVGVGFCEGIAVSGETMFRFSDTQGTPSAVSKFRCLPARK